MDRKKLVKMKIVNNPSGTFYIGVAAYNRNSVLILDTGEYGCLKVLANADKYFKTYYPEFYRIDTSVSKTRLTNKLLKEMFIHSLETKYKWSLKEKEELAKYFKVKLEVYLSESKSCTRVKGYKKPTTNKRVKTYARKRK